MRVIDFLTNAESNLLKIIYYFIISSTVNDNVLLKLISDANILSHGSQMKSIFSIR